MSLEKRIEDLTVAIKELTVAVKTLDDRPAQEPRPQDSIIETTHPPITRDDLKEFLKGVAMTHAPDGQKIIGEIILKVAGTQALSQVEEAHLPIIREKVASWVDSL